MGLGLAHIKGNLMFKIRPLIDHRIVHVNRIPDQIGQKTNRIFMIRDGSRQNHTAALFFICPFLGRNGAAGRPIHDLPPALLIVPRIYFQKLRADTRHQRNGKSFLLRHIKPGHNIALLHLVRIRLRPGVILPGCIIGRIYLGIYFFQAFRVICSVTVPDGICTPALQ